MIFTSVELVKQLMEKATTRTGLQVTVDILDKSVPRRGGKYAEGFKENMKIVFDEILPKLNYRERSRAAHEVGELLNFRSYGGKSVLSHLPTNVHLISRVIPREPSPNRRRPSRRKPRDGPARKENTCPG